MIHAIIDSIKHIFSQVGGHPVTFPVAAEIQLHPVKNWKVLCSCQCDRMSNLGCDWKGYWMPSVSNWITRFSFSYSAKSVTENSRKNITGRISRKCNSLNHKSTQSLKHTFSLIVITPLNSNYFSSSATTVRAVARIKAPSTLCTH